MIENFEFDVFIAYARPDARYAKRLHSVLTAAGHRVFLDTESLLGGDPWPQRIKQAQQASLLTVVLISNRFDAAYFEQEEVLQAIKLARLEGIRRVVPVYLTKRKGDVPTLLEKLYHIFWKESTSLLSVAQGIEAALRASQKYGTHQVDSSTVVIVTGCHFLPELFDRPSAYELKAAIDDFGRTAHRAFLPSIVMGDIWFLQHSNMQGHPSVVSIGSAGMNALTKTIADQGKIKKSAPEKRWQIAREGDRWALFGNRAEDTRDAVLWFKDRLLPAFLEELWS